MGAHDRDVAHLTKRDLDAISTDKLWPIMATVFPRFDKLTQAEKQTLQVYLTRYLAHRRKTRSITQDHRRNAHDTARKGLSSEANLDRIRTTVYDSSHLSPRREFIIDVERIKIRYDSQMTSNSYPTAQFDRLRNALLDIASLKPHPLRTTELSQSDFIASPQTLESKDVAEREREDIRKRLSAGLDALADSETPRILDVTHPTSTQFGETWQIVKAITGKYLSVNQDLSKDSIAIGGNQATNHLQLIARDDNPTSRDHLVELKVHYFPTGRFDLTATAFPTRGNGGIPAEWSIEHAPPSTRQFNVKPLIRQLTRCFKRVSRFLHNLEDEDIARVTATVASEPTDIESQRYRESGHTSQYSTQGTHDPTHEIE